MGPPGSRGVRGVGRGPSPYRPVARRGTSNFWLHFPIPMCNHQLHIPRASRRATMAEIRHRVGVNAPIDDVYRAVATADGVRQWWTRDVSGDAQVGGKLVFGFPSPDRGATVEIVELVPDRTVVWQVVE